MPNKMSQNYEEDAHFKSARNTILGCPVLLRLANNETYHGIFATLTPDFDVMLECCHRVDAPSETFICGRSLPRRQNVKARQVFKCAQVVDMVAHDVDKDFALNNGGELNLDDSLPIQPASNSSSSSTSDDENRELEPYVFESGGDQDNSSVNLDSSGSSELLLSASSSVSHSSASSLVGGWSVEDMLLINEIKYGYKSTFNADMAEYTMPLRRDNSEEYKRREKLAEKFAREIESDYNYKLNLDKELSDGECEEFAFSAVHREVNNNSGKQKNQNNSQPKSGKHNNGQQNKNSSSNKAQTVNSRRRK